MAAELSAGVSGTLLKTAQGRDKYVIKKAIIELRKDQYVIKNAFKPPVNCKNIIKSRRICKLDDGYSFDEEGYIIPEGVSLCNPIICSAVLCNYSGLKQDSWGDCMKRLDSLLFLRQ